MKNEERLRTLSAVSLVVLFVMVWGCARQSPPPADTGKIPITTSSDEARKEYLQGRDLADRLLQPIAIPHFENAIAKDPNFALAFLSMASVAPTTKVFLENMNKAVSLADKVSEGERLLILGFEAGATGNPTKQKEHFDKLVSLFPNDQRAHFALGNYYYGQQDYTGAIAHFQKATEIDPAFSPAYNLLGYASMLMEAYGDAEQAFKKYIELIPDDPNPYDSYGELLLTTGKFDESIAQYQKALAMDPTFFGSRLGIAANLMYQGKASDAAAALQKAYDMARNDGERRGALRNAAILYVDGGKMDLALQETDKLYAMAEKIEDVAQMSADLMTKGEIFLEMGKPDEARAALEKSAQMVAGSALSQAIKDNVALALRYNAGMVALKKKDLKGAKTEAEAFQKGAAAAQNQNLIRQAHELAGAIALEEKAYDTAIAELKQSSQLNPYNLYRLALAYLGKGDKANAKAVCTRAARSYGLPFMNYAFVRAKAEKMLGKM